MTTFSTCQQLPLDLQTITHNLLKLLRATKLVAIQSQDGSCFSVLPLLHTLQHGPTIP
ncbi:hypothetical protein PAXINDRAFT_17546 [Paxillus involutus ATCC 200175]|uniref:Uncharacterized protein n=1 Tax=Paxillus involutus ATCC 200175 TaxID=664439 RepID=A0A0C9TEI2_PAXIN|nr:hypothetical protein PAXINDRAFT_17546 [Paxillus involutus ATCC 200175]